MSDPQIDPLDLAHYVSFGYPGAPPAQRVTGNRRPTRPIQQPRTVPWTIHVPHTEVIKLFYGFKPQAMEEKWAIHTAGPDLDHDGTGAFTVHMARSWTGFEMIVLRVEAAFEHGDNLIAGKDAKITQITWGKREKSADDGEAESKKVAMEVCRWVLRCKLVDPAAGTDEDAG